MYKYSHQQQATCSNGQTKERVTINIINRKWLDTLFSNADMRTLLNQFWNALHSQLQNQNHHLKRRKLHHLVLLLWVRAGKSYDDVCRNKFRLLRQSPQSAQVYKFYILLSAYINIYLAKHWKKVAHVTWKSRKELKC